MMRPFKWPHPLIFSVPESLLPLLDSPVPFFFGLNKAKDFLTKEKLPENYPEIIFYCIDESAVFCDDKEMKKIISSQPYFDNLKLRIKEIYTFFNSTQTSYITKKDNNKVGVMSTPKNLLYNPKTKEENKCLEIIRILRGSLQIYICKLLEDFLKANTKFEVCLLFFLFLKKLSELIFFIREKKCSLRLKSLFWKKINKILIIRKLLLYFSFLNFLFLKINEKKNK